MFITFIHFQYAAKDELVSSDNNEQVKTMRKDEYKQTMKLIISNNYNILQTETVLLVCTNREVPLPKRYLDAPRFTQ